jgi:alkylmercury lyase-like protein
VTARELEVRRRIFESFATTGDCPRLEEPDALAALAERHVVVLDPRDPERVLMAHPFAARGSDASVVAGGQTWWGNCAWDALGIVGALRVADATVQSGDVSLTIREGSVVEEDVLFHVAVPAARWWEDIAFT